MDCDTAVKRLLKSYAFFAEPTNHGHSHTGLMEKQEEPIPFSQMMAATVERLIYSGIVMC
jgi:hypothetical protein